MTLADIAGLPTSLMPAVELRNIHFYEERSLYDEAILRKLQEGLRDKRDALYRAVEMSQHGPAKEFLLHRAASCVVVLMDIKQALNAKAHGAYS
ncbi:hypothetical protein HYV81_04405 [Candidatus Woesearchaeota archaeon]|nr:hypothetical protein [Candidatus Woesearchaeota archaeon]